MRIRKSTVTPTRYASLENGRVIGLGDADPLPEGTKFTYRVGEKEWTPVKTNSIPKVNNVSNRNRSKEQLPLGGTSAQSL